MFNIFEVGDIVKIKSSNYDYMEEDQEDIDEYSEQRKTNNSMIGTTAKIEKIFAVGYEYRVKSLIDDTVGFFIVYDLELIERPAKEPAKFKEGPGLMNKNFQWGDEVVFVNTGSNELEGRFGKVVGKPVIELCDFYLVDLGEPVSNVRPDTVVFITEACLSKVPEKVQTIDMPSDVNDDCLEAYEDLTYVFSKVNSNDNDKNNALDKFFSVINQYNDMIEFGMWALRDVVRDYDFKNVNMKQKNIKEFWKKI